MSEAGWKPSCCFFGTILFWFCNSSCRILEKQSRLCSAPEQFKNHRNYRAPLVAQWLRISLPMQGTRVRALVREEPTCCGATNPVRHNYWVCALEPASHNYWARVPQLLKPMRQEPVLCNKRSHHDEKPMHHNKEEPPLAATRESLRAATKTQCSQK